ncbi:putative cytosol aminopeptidase [Nocardioides psychrotolerans]|uniref:Probable cytosol aminopeptidase n=1 Tax=Nocardioides psychrotolerans TaxID=1005945 RepID=A0A1I3FJL5_9ACTN|nr:leucyl aminopeptidase [Nocardioides psychrotolerans]GEP37174.1 putative cytosol aminopeptidase [Nocardioides psychrotolerans]SFI11458.1 leucyl aminopeptidase [Nocardioides psychrotolerans]
MTTTYTLRSASPAKTRADAVVVGILSTAKGPQVAPGGEDVAKAYGRKLAPLLATLGVKGKAGEVVKVPTSGTITSPLLVLVGLGDEATPTSVRRAAGGAVRAVTNAASVAIALPADSPELVRALTEGAMLGAYTFTAYKKDANGSEAPGDVVLLCPNPRRKEMTTAFEEAQVVARAVAQTRDWVNTPPGDLTPPAFAEAAVASGKEWTKGRGGPKVTVTVLDEKRLAELGCGGILGVGAASAAPPRLVEITYAPKDARCHLALVGKGITFDSGGLTIKPAQGMGEMKSDMSGAAAVIQATFAIAALGLPIKVSTFAAMAENMVSGSAIRPGDVITQYGGTTVEILNTDAEGRLVLADALGRAAEQQPDVLLDVATLTGHMVLALGDRVAGVMGTDEIVQGVLAASEVAGEDHWPMPIPEGMVERVKGSKIADLAQHDWVRWGGALFAGAFLREFTHGLPWAHLDIAGTAFNSGGPRGHVTSGGTGWAVTTLVDYARALSAEK